MQLAPVTVELSEQDTAAIIQAALDYAEGWYEGNPAKTERSLHPDLAKRIVATTPQGDKLSQMSAMGLVQIVRTRIGSTPPEVQQKDVTILDVFNNIASVKAVMNDWVDYLHIAKFNGQWVIVNVLWSLKTN